MNDVIHVVPGTVWVVEALAALGIATLASLLGVAIALAIWHCVQHAQGGRT